MTDLSKLTDARFEELLDTAIERSIDAMDISDLVALVRDNFQDYYFGNADSEEQEAFIRMYCEDLLHEQ